MKTNYEAPQIEVIEIEVEDVLCQSATAPSTADSPSNFSNGGGAW
ncbi:MAG: hypothetical protein SNH55_08520 [Rikenellaceae bacterium]